TDQPQAVKNHEKHDQSEQEEHAHGAGTHGGRIVPIGMDNYHAEAVFEKGGTLKLYILGKNEAKVQEGETQRLTAHVRSRHGTQAEPMTLQPDPQQGDTAGKTSQFIGKLPAAFVGQKVEVTIPIKIAGERFRFTVASTPIKDESHEEERP